MEQTEKLLRLVESEFGECPTWRPLLDAAWNEIATIGKAPQPLTVAPQPHPLRYHNLRFHGKLVFERYDGTFHTDRVEAWEAVKGLEAQGVDMSPLRKLLEETKDEDEA